MTKKKSSVESGFSLVELIVVMLILSVVMTAAMSLVIPTKRATVVQSDLATVQGGMRVALERMSKDFRNAGFLINGNPVTGYPDVATTTNETVTVNPTSGSPLIIHTRSVSGRFGRVDAIPASPSQPFALVYDDQFTAFPVGAYAAVVEPVNGTLLGDPATNGNAPNNIYKVMSSSSGQVKLGDESGNELVSVEPFSGAVAGLVMLVAPSTNPSDLNRQIKFWLEDGTLKRQVDAGNIQNLARGITGLTFTVVEDDDGDVCQVTIELEGETVEAGNDAVGSAKRKRMSTLISLRNV